MKYTIVFLLISLNCLSQTTVVKVPPSKDTTIITFNTSVTASAATSYTTTVIPPKPVDSVITTPPITPGRYEGFGSQAVGGSKIVNVASKSDFDREVQNPNGKIITFTSSVTFNGRYEFTNKSYFTITANGYDVTINNNNNGDGISFGEGTHHAMLIGMRVINAGNDCINVVDNAHDILIDHCSAYDGRDGNIDIAATSGQNVTVQWCFIGRNNGSGRTLVTCKNVSIHHNLFAATGSGEGSERNPFIHCNYSPVGSPNCDFRNNIVFNWGRYGSGIGYKATGNFVNNYYATNKGGAIDPNADPSGNTASYFSSGNVQLGGGSIDRTNHGEYIIPDPYKITIKPAKEAAQDVLQGVGTARRNDYENSVIKSIVIQ